MRARRAAAAGSNRLLGRITADLRSSQRVMSPRTTARVVVATAWAACLPDLLVGAAGYLQTGRWEGSLLGLFFMALVLPLPALPVHVQARFYLSLALLSPAAVLFYMLRATDPLIPVTASVEMLVVPLASFMIWGRRLGLVASLASLLTLVVAVRSDLLPLRAGIAVGLVAVSLAVMLGWAAHTSERLEHDALTGLGNRRALDQRLERELGRSGADPLFLAVLDVDGVRRLNEERGRSAVDGLLDAVGAHLAHHLPDDASLYHLGSGEFVALLGGRRERVLERVEALVVAPVAGVSLSAGMAEAEPGDTGARLLTRAETSLARGKSGGGHGLDPLLVDDTLVHELRRGFSEGRFTVLYQPIVDLQTGTTTGAEALVRWDHPTRGRIGPDVFVPIAEQTGVVHPLGAFVLHRACEDVVEAEAAGQVLHRVSVNVSALELQRADYADDVLAIVTATGLDPQRLVLEVTESSVLGDDGAVARTLNRLRAHGIRVAIDDFGTGYSSLSRLGQMPVDLLKIDKSFVWTEDAAARDSLLTAVVGLARSFGLSTVAEGVETWDQADLLRALGCTLGQGYLFGRPAAFEELDLPAVTGGQAAVPHPRAAASPDQSRGTGTGRPGWSPPRASR